MPLFLSHIAVKIQGLCSVYIVYGAKVLHLAGSTIRTRDLITESEIDKSTCGLRNMAIEKNTTHTVCGKRIFFSIATFHRPPVDLSISLSVTRCQLHTVEPARHNT